MTDGGAKGRKAEREVAKQQIQPWWRKLEPTAEFVRTPLSGGWAGVEVRSKFKACGDIMTTAERWPFVVEVKRREGWTCKNLFACRHTAVWKWWVKAQQDAADQGGVPMLWCKRNSEPWIVLLPLDYVAKVILKHPKMRSLLLPDVTLDVGLLKKNGIDVGLVPCVFIADTFLQIDPKLFALEA